MKTLTLSDSAFNELAALFSPAPTAPGPTTPAATIPAGYTLLPITQHIVQLPIPEDYSYSGYVIRTAPVHLRGSETWTLSWYQWIDAKGAVPTRSDWPEVLDRYLNIDAYDPAGKPARDAAKAAQAAQGWVAVGTNAPPTSASETV